MNELDKDRIDKNTFKILKTLVGSNSLEAAIAITIAAHEIDNCVEEDFIDLLKKVINTEVGEKKDVKYN